MAKNNVLLIFLATLLMSGAVQAKAARTIHLNEDRTEPIYIGIAGTVINFPSRPSKVILGNKGAFAVEYINDDLAVSTLRAGARSNLFVYLDGRRFGFNLISTGSGGDEIVMVRDKSEKKMKVKVTYE